MSGMPDPFEDLDPERLRLRQSQMWATHPAHVLPAFVAEMDFPLAEPIARALARAIELGDCGYASGAGLADAFAGFAASRMGWTVPPDRVFLVGDVMAGVVETLSLVTRPGDGVVINTPVYPPFYSILAEVGRRVVTAPLRRLPDGWQLDLDAVEAALAGGARAYLLCSPHNPTGRVFARSELACVAELAGRYGVSVVSDEIHAPLTLPGGPVHTPYASLGESAAAGAVTVTSASKAWNIAGLKCAVVVAGAAAIRDRLATLSQDVRDRAGHLGVIASVAAFRDGGPWLDALLAHLARNRAYLAELIAARLPEVGYAPPEAGYLAWLDCSRLGLGDDPSEAFLDRGGVALASGLSFGPEGAGFARLSFGTSRAILAEAVERMAAAAA